MSFDAATRVLAGELSAAVTAINMTYTAVPATDPPQFFFFSFTGVAAPTLSGQADLSFTALARSEALLTNAEEGATPYSYTLAGTSSESISELIPGLVFDGKANRLFGVPRAAKGETALVHTVSDDVGNSAVQTFNITVEADATAPDLSYVTQGGSALLSFALTVGVPITRLEPDFSDAPGDLLSYSLTSGALPPGLELEPVTGYISGTPTTATTLPAAVTVGLSDLAGNDASFDLSFPAVSKGRHSAAGIEYPSRILEVGMTLAPIIPPDFQGTLGFTELVSSCGVNNFTGVVEAREAGLCEFGVNVEENDNYEESGALRYYLLVLEAGGTGAEEIQDTFRAANSDLLTFVTSALGKQPDATFTTAEVAGLTELTYADARDRTGASDLSPLSYAVGLTYLSLANSVAEDDQLSYIETQGSLTTLDLSGNDIGALDYLSLLTNLRHLDLSDQEDAPALDALLDNPGLGAGDTVDLSGAISQAVLPIVAELERRGVTVIADHYFPIALGDTSEEQTLTGDGDEDFYLLHISEPGAISVLFSSSRDPSESSGSIQAIVSGAEVGDTEPQYRIQTGVSTSLTSPTLLLDGLSFNSNVLAPGAYYLSVRSSQAAGFSYSFSVAALEGSQGMVLSSDQIGERAYSYTDTDNGNLGVTVVGQAYTAVVLEGVASLELPPSLGDLGGATRAAASAHFHRVDSAVPAIPAEFTHEGLADADYSPVDLSFGLLPTPAEAVAVRVCLPLSAALIATGERPVLLHYGDSDGDGSDEWSSVARVYDRSAQVVCGDNISDFSPFAVGVGGVLEDLPPLVGLELRSDQPGEYDYTYTTSAGASVVVVGVANTEAGLQPQLPGAVTVRLPPSLGEFSGDSITIAADFSAVGTAIPDPTFTHEELSANDYTRVDIALAVRPASVDDFFVRVCLPVTTNLARLVQPVLLHYSNGAWSQVADAEFVFRSRRICVKDFPSNDFSPFAVGAGEELMGLNQDQRSDLLKRTVGAMSRSSAQTVVNVISRRLSAAPEDKAQAHVAGYTLQADTWRDNFARQFYADAKALGQGKDLQLAKTLRASSFTLPLLDQGVTLWGATGGLKFDGSPEDGTLTTDYDGEVFSVLFGVDGAIGESRRLGVALGYSDGDLEYTGRAGDLSESGDIEQTMLGVYPYMSWHPRAGLSLWVLGGIGVGEYDISKQPENGPVDQADSVDATQWTLALGGEKAVFTEDKWNDNWDAVLRVKGLWNVLELDDVVYDSGEEVPELDAESWRFALENEMGYRFALSGGASIRPYGLVGLRWDSGDVVGDDSVFVDASGGLVFESAAGLALDVAFRAQLNNGDTEEHALTATGSLSYDSAQDGRGFQLALKHDMGGFGGLSSRHSSWDAYDFNDTPAALSPSDAARMETELGYAWPLQPLRKMRPGVLQTYLRSTFQDTADRHAVGFNFRTPTLDLRLEAAHHQPTSVSGLSAPSAEALLKAQLRF